LRARSSISLDAESPSGLAAAKPCRRAFCAERAFPDRHVVKTPKSLDVLFDKRDPVSIATMFALDKVPVFKERTEKVDASLKAKSTKIFTLAALYDANSDLLKEQEDDDVEGNTIRLVDYWTSVAEHMPDWGKVLKGHKMATELRAESISAHSTVLRTLGGLGSDLMKSLIMGAILPLYSAPEKLFFINGLFDVRNS
jgi:hypothetical protein